MPRAELPKRIPLDRSAAPVADYEPPPIELVERAVEALREWAAQGATYETPAMRPGDVTQWPC
jgi:hypothetical protein